MTGFVVGGNNRGKLCNLILYWQKEEKAKRKKNEYKKESNYFVNFNNKDFLRKYKTKFGKYSIQLL